MKLRYPQTPLGKAVENFKDVVEGLDPEEWNYKNLFHAYDAICIESQYLICETPSDEDLIKLIKMAVESRPGWQQAVLVDDIREMLNGY